MSSMVTSALLKVISSYVCLYRGNDSRMVGWIFVKFFVVFMPFEANTKFSFLIFYNQQYQYGGNLSV